MKKICIVAGARPNFMKVAPLIKEFLSVRDVETLIVHTGQHYDKDMSGLFFEELEIPEPDIFLGVGSGSHAKQTASIMTNFEKVLLEAKPDTVVVVGDVNSTLACSITAAKLHIRIAHVEAGLRSFDRTMPEEINRVLTDAISDLLFITEESARSNLHKEGIPDEKIHFVGNVMIDTLLRYREKAEQSGVLHRLGLAAGNPGTRGTASKYAVLTLHRPSNVDSKANFTEIADALQRISKQVPIIFPVHPRTLKHIREFGLESSFHFIPDGDQSKVRENAVNCIGPLGYLEFLHLMARSSLVLTDSGGIQEETTILGVPCVTIRDNTERPVTVTCGTNRLAGTKKEAIVCEGLRALRNRTTRNAIPPLWDGRAAKRITGILLEALAGEGKR